MFWRLADVDLLIGMAVATLVIPAVFVALVVVAGVRRQRGHVAGGLLAGLLAGTGGLSLGTLLLFADEPVLWLPLVGAAIAIPINRWRARRRVEAGWFVAGAGAPWLVVWAILVVAPPASASPADQLEAPPFLAGAAAVVLAGLGIALRGDPPPPPPSMHAPAGQPGSRDVGSIAAAIREPSVIGPFGLPEVAMLAGFLAAWLVVPFALPRDVPTLPQLALSAVAGAVIGTEAYIRAMTTRTRRAFEAFSWLGEWELARVKAITGGGVPVSAEDAEHWLAARPERPEEHLIRIEVLAYVGRFQEAHALLAKLPTGTPWEAFELTALRDLVSWREGGDGDLPGMEEAAGDLQPRDGDDRLRADVMIAVARVRRLMAATVPSPPDEAVRPFLEVRERLGRRADGQVGRALRPRIVPGLIVVGVVLGLVGEVLYGGGRPLL